MSLVPIFLLLVPLVINRNSLRCPAITSILHSMFVPVAPLFRQLIH